MKGLAALTSSRKHNWNTPYDIFAPLNLEFNFKLDPCTIATNPLKTPKFYTPVEDGLAQPWEDMNYCNPPFDKIPQWLSKAWHEREVRKATSVFLLPSRTGTRWFHRFIYDKEKWEFRPGISVRLLQGRKKFVDPERQLQAKAGSTFDVMIAIIRPVI